MSKKMRGNILLLLTAFIWGSAFVAQKAGMDYIQPFTFNGIRCLIGAIVLIPVVMIFAKGDPVSKEATDEEKKAHRKTLIIGGICCGLVIFTASSLQQYGLMYTTAGKSGFITALYVVLTPVCGIFLKRKIRPITWFCVMLALFGLYLLCFKPGEPLNLGDLVTFISAFAFTAHIFVIDYFSPKVNGVKLSCIQFFVAGIISLPLAFIFEDIVWADVLTCWLPILYAGALSCGVAYTLQIIAQKDTDPMVTSILMSMESVFGVICAAIVLHEMMSLKELIGCAVMFAAIIIVQLPSKEARGAKEEEAV